VLILSCAGCGAQQAGVPVDAAVGDTGGPGRDTGGNEDRAADAPAPADAPALTDASPPADAAWADQPGIPCGDSLANVYGTPSLPALTPAARGDVVRCAPDVTYDLSAVQGQLSARGIATPARSGAAIYRIAYRTTRGTGAAGVGTARVYLPAAPLPPPLPVIVVGHATSGLAASCAPSKDPTTNQDSALPWAALGYAVIAPDYAGLGNDDPVQGYVDNRDTAYSVLDAARALRKLLPASALSPQVLLQGWSQGGGAVLSAQALARAYGCDGTLAGVIVFAAEWPTRMNSFGYVAMLSNPTQLTIQTGISNPVVAVLRQYAYSALYLGPTHATETFPAAKRTGIGGAVMSQCYLPLGGYLQGATPHVGDFLDETFRQTLLACINGPVDGGPGCVDPGQSYHAFLTQNILTADASGPPLLYVQGLLDYIMPAASEAACNLAKLQADGVTPQVCVDPGAQHTDVVGRNQDFAMQWGQAVLQGAPPPTCSAVGMPPCTP
jgi:dienelactone hydrolase